MELEKIKNNMLKSLEKRKNYEESISFLRKELDLITEEIIDLLMKRALIVKYVGETKKKHNKPFIVKSREEEIMKKIDNLVNKKNKELKKISNIKLDVKIVKNLMRELIDFALKIEK
jgi:chorismate mutase